MDALSLILDKHVLITTAISAAAFASGYAVNTPTPHMQECAPEITHVKTLEKQLAIADQVTHDRVIEATRACKETEEKVCREKIDTFKVTYRRLRCSICEQEDNP